MSKKIVKNYVYHGFGFPVELHNVEMVMFDGELHPKIDVRKVSDSVIKSLVLQKTRLTGNQIKFIRTYFSMSLRKFAKVIKESHMAVKKWEDFGDKETNMDLNIEMMLRLHVYDEVVIKAEKNKKEAKAKFYDQFTSLNEILCY